LPFLFWYWPPWSLHIPRWPLSISYDQFDNLCNIKQKREELDLLPIEDLRALLGQGEKVLQTLSDQKKENDGVEGGKRKPRDFVPTSDRNVNKHRHADTFKPSPTKSSEDSFKPVSVKPPKSEKIVVQNDIAAKTKQTPSTTNTELIPETTSTTRPSTSPPPSSSTSSPPTTPSAELLATADPTLLGALGHASPEILAALQEAAPENLKVFLTFAKSSTENDPNLI